MAIDCNRNYLRSTPGYEMKLNVSIPNGMVKTKGPTWVSHLLLLLLLESNSSDHGNCYDDPNFKGPQPSSGRVRGRVVGDSEKNGTGRDNNDDTVATIAKKTRAHWYTTRLGVASSTENENENELTCE